MKYSIADFRQLVTAWYNEFLPVECKDRFAFVKDAEILYLNSINLDLIRKKTMDFMKMKVKETSEFLGYSDEANFSRAFRNYFGFYPQKLSLFDGN